MAWWNSISLNANLESRQVLGFTQKVYYIKILYSYTNIDIQPESNYRFVSMD